jgi:hypothetical protein
LYPWHPWSGLSVHVHEVSERGNATALRCSLAGDAGRCLEVPAWMFEREACVPLAVASRPRVGVGALSALRRLLAEATGSGPTDASASAAEGDSPDQNRGEAHATPPRPPPGDAGAPSSATDLFVPSPAASGPGAAVWWALPEETRRTLAGLVARLLLQHGAGEAPRAGGRRHDP